MIDLIAAKRLCWPMRGVLRMGGSDSESSTKTVDARVVGGDASRNVSVSGDHSAVTLTETDHGSVAGALDLAKKGVEGAYSLAGAAQASNGDLLTGALKASSSQAEQFAKTVADIKTSDVRVLIIAGLAVVGLAAASFMKGGK